MGRVALVTGGTRGIGAAIVKKLKSEGYTVAANYFGNGNSALKFGDQEKVKLFRWDVSDFDACIKGVAEVSAELGDPEILINNAGITQDSMMHKMSFEQWDAVIKTNLTSCFNMARAVIGPMREKGFGRIISISSINGQKGQVGQTNYSAAKAGIIGFTKALAQENAIKGITVNAIAPGYTATEMVSAMPEKVLEQIVTQIPVGRLGKPEEIADIVAFLAADTASFITGSTISANGGQYFV